MKAFNWPGKTTLVGLPLLVILFALAGYYVGQAPVRPLDQRGAFVFGVADLSTVDTEFVMLIERELQAPLIPVKLTSEEQFRSQVDDLDFWLAPTEWSKTLDQYSTLHPFQLQRFIAPPIEPHPDFFHRELGQSQFIERIPYLWKQDSSGLQILAWSFHRERIPFSLAERLLNVVYQSQVAGPWATARRMALTFGFTNEEFPEELRPQQIRARSFIEGSH